MQTSTGYTLVPIARSKTTMAIILLSAVISLGDISSGTPPTDMDITFAVEKGIAGDPAISSRLIDIDCQKGVVKLSGIVANLLEYDRAFEVAQSTLGVIAIINRLTINPVYRPDSDIKTDIEAAFAADPVASLYPIKISVDRATATLTGTVPSLEEQLFIGDIACKVRGLKKIDNKIAVKMTKNPSPGDIEKEIREILKWDPYLNANLISVKVQNSVVKLEGTVGSLSEKAFAHDDAILPGVIAIDDSLLLVKPWDRQFMKKAGATVIRSDDGITQSVRRALADDSRIARFNLDVSVSNGVVTLRGKVNTLYDVELARKDAENVTGTAHVVSMLRVRPENQIGDSALELKVRQAVLRDPTLEKKEITPVARNGIVRLYGNVDSYFERDYCARMLSSIPGIIDIKNFIAVIAPPQPWKDDDEIRADIEFDLQWIAQLRDDSVAVKVDNGIATLSGRVGTPTELALVVETAFRSGAREVRVNITHYGERENGIFHAGDIYSSLLY